MANFTTEAAVRLKLQATDTVSVPAALVTQSIDDAHGRIVAVLDAAVDTESPVAGLVLGETLLAGAALLRSLASGDAAGGKQIQIGGNRVDTSRRYAALMAQAATTEAEAWEALAVFVASVPARVVVGVTDSTAVLGDGD